MHILTLFFCLTCVMLWYSTLPCSVLLIFSLCRGRGGRGGGRGGARGGERRERGERGGERRERGERGGGRGGSSGGRGAPRGGRSGGRVPDIANADAFPTLG